VKRRVATLLPLLLDLVVPTLGYFLLHALGLSDVWALTVAGSAAAVLVVGNSVRLRHLDLLGVLVCVELVLAIVLAVVTDDPKLVLARAAFYLAVGGVVLLASGFRGRPVTYTTAEPMATKGDPLRARAYAVAWERSAAFRGIHARLSIVIGLGMLAYAVLRIVIIYTASSIAEAVWVQEVPGLILIVGVLVLIRTQVPKLRKIVDAEQAALEPAAAEPSRPVSPAGR
jgi:hypothetical protein